MTSVSSMSAGIDRSTPAKHDARGRAVGSHYTQRQAEQLVDAGVDVSQIQSFDDDDAAPEEHVVRGSARPLELFHRQIVDPDDFDAVREEKPRTCFAETDVVLVEFRRAPELRIGG